MHMAVSLGLMPTTGLTLPFMSYGRSSQVISLLATGILINIGALAGQAAGGTTAAGAGRRGGERVTRGNGRRTILIAGGGTGGHLTPALAIAAAIGGARETDSSRCWWARCAGVEARILPTRDFRYHLLPSEPIYRRSLVEERPLAAARRPPAPRGGRAAAGRAPGRRARHRRVRLRAGGLARRARRTAHRDPGAERLSRASRPAGSAAGCATSTSACPNRGACSASAAGPRCSTPATRSCRRRRSGGPRHGSCSGSSPARRSCWSPAGARVRSRSIARSPGGWRRAARSSAALIWVTGRGTYEEFARFHRPPRVQVVDFLDPMADGYAVADLVVSRAGMITVAELCAWGLPSILIPLPTAAADHQTHNARVLAEAGASHACCRSRSSRRRGWPRRWNGYCRRMVHASAMAKRARARGKPEAARGDSVKFIDAGSADGSHFENSQRQLTLAQSIMDLFNPADTRPVHFMGIGGAGMSALALIACRRGVAVTGCDADPAGAADLSAARRPGPCRARSLAPRGCPRGRGHGRGPDRPPGAAPGARAGPADRSEEGRPGRTRG